MGREPVRSGNLSLRSLVTILASSLFALSRIARQQEQARQHGEGGELADEHREGGEEAEPDRGKEVGEDEDGEAGDDDGGRDPDGAADGGVRAAQRPRAWSPVASSSRRKRMVYWMAASMPTPIAMEAIMTVTRSSGMPAQPMTPSNDRGGEGLREQHDEREDRGAEEEQTA